MITDDGGAIYTGSGGAGTIIDSNINLYTIGLNPWNTTTDVQTQSIYLDNMSSNILVTNNTVAYNRNHTGMYLSNPSNVTISGNTTYTSEILILNDAVKKAASLNGKLLIFNGKVIRMT